jgi:hypothetical protein
MLEEASHLITGSMLQESLQRVKSRAEESNGDPVGPIDEGG